MAVSKNMGYPGIDLLDGIKTDTGEMKSSLNNINNTLGTFVIEQREHNQWMKEHLIKMDVHNQRLEKILENSLIDSLQLLSQGKYLYVSARRKPKRMAHQINTVERYIIKYSPIYKTI